MSHRRSTFIAILSLACLCLLFSAVSCGGSDDPQTDGDEMTDGDDDSDGDEPQVTDGDQGVDGDDSHEIADGELSGRWAMKFAVTHSTCVPILEEPIQLILTGIALVEIEHDHLELTFTEEICDYSMNSPEDLDFYVIFTNDTIAAIETMARRADLEILSTGADFIVDRTVDIYGADKTLFDDAENDLLPIEEDDGRLVDFEDDGKPAATAQIRGFVKGEVYVVIRIVRDLIGKVVTRNLIEGQVNSNVKMNTIGANSPIMNIQLDLQEAGNDGTNRFQMIRLDQSLNCADLYEDAQELFGYDPFDFADPFDEDMSCDAL